MWEYKVIDCSELYEFDIENKLNELGKCGWELVSIIAINNNPNNIRTRYILKRNTPYK
jgi:hypothetical protein